MTQQWCSPSALSASQTGLCPPRGRGCCLKQVGQLSLPPSGWCWGPDHPEVMASQAKAPSSPSYSRKPSFPRRRGKENKKRKEKEDKRPLSRVPQWMGMGAAAGGAEAEAELRRRVQSWASPPWTRGWLARCDRRPSQTAPWGQRRSACRRRTGSRREPTGPRWKAGGSGGGTRERYSRGRPGWGGGGTIRDADPGGEGPPGQHEALPGQVARAGLGSC